MIIHLNEIPEEGKSYIWNNQTAELNLILQDLIGNTSYSAEFFIKPLQQGTFQLTGKMRTQLPEECSRCGLDFNLAVDERFKELMIPSSGSGSRTSHFAKANHFSDLKEEAPSVVEYNGNQFNMGEYLHEVVALAEPNIPAPPVTKDDNCSLCLKNVRQIQQSYEDKGFEGDRKNPFDVLKGLKLN